MDNSKGLLIYGGAISVVCVLGAIALSFAPGNNQQAIQTLLGTALPSGISGVAGAFQGMTGKKNSDNNIIEADSYTLSQNKLTPNSSQQSAMLKPYMQTENNDYIHEDYRP